MRKYWSALGGQLGIGFVLGGVILLFLGWNGAASYDRVPSQFPYLISGGLAGVGLMFVGGALLIVQSARADRAALESGLAELRDALDVIARSGSASANGAGADAGVVAGPSSFHRPTCALVEGRGPLPRMSAEEAQAAGLSACRVCDPVGSAAPRTAVAAAAPAGRSAGAAKRGAAKKVSAPRAPAKKSTAKKSPAKKSTPKKTGARKQTARRAR